MLITVFIVWTFSPINSPNCVDKFEIQTFWPTIWGKFAAPNLLEENIEKSHSKHPGSTHQYCLRSTWQSQEKEKTKKKRWSCGNATLQSSPQRNQKKNEERIRILNYRPMQINWFWNKNRKQQSGLWHSEVTDCWPEVAGYVISAENVKTIEGYATLNFEVASLSSFRDIKNHFVTAAEADINDSIKRKRIRVSPKKLHAQFDNNYLTRTVAHT